VFIAYFLPALRDLQILVAYLAPVVLVIGLILAINLYQQGPAELSILPFIIGAILLIGGAAFDMLATVLRSPTLTREANPIARALLNSDHSLAFVYVYGFVTQFLYVFFTSTLWAAFLRHWGVVIALANRSRPRSYSEFIKAATGGGHLSWRQYLLPIKFSELSKSYFMVWLIPIFWVGMSPYRWFLALEWFGLAPMPRNTFLAFLIPVVLTIYLIWLWYEYLKSIQNANGQ
jgi:hypothetical protein